MTRADRDPTLPEAERPWEFAQDDEWDVASDIAAQMDEWGAGSISAILRDKQDRVMATHAFAVIGEFEVAARFDADDGSVLWAYRPLASDEGQS